MDDYEFCSVSDYLEPEQGDGIFNMNEMAAAIENTILLETSKTRMNVTPKLIKSWKPGIKFDVGKRFMGYPSHVDNNGIIYVQPRDLMTLLAEMNQKITRYYEDLEFIGKIRNAETFKVGDCVIARYKPDMKFYRAVIENIIDKEYRVHYVDYGTRNNIKSTEMYSMVIGENIPICALRFVLTDIWPFRNLRWSREEISFFHSRLLDNLCNVDIKKECPQYDDIQGVAIEVLAKNKQIKDIAQQAVYEGYGRPRKLSSDDPWPIEFIFPDRDLPEDNDKETDAKRERLVNPHYYEASIPITGNRTQIGKSKIVKKTNYLDLHCIESEKFKCALVDVCDARNLVFYIRTKFLKEIQVPFKKLLDHFAKTPPEYFKTFNSLSRAINKPCLVKSSNTWYRGEILKIDKPTQSANVFFVDTGKTDNVPVSDLRQMDMRSLKCPRKLVKVKLNTADLVIDPDRRGDLTCWIMEDFKSELLTAFITGYDDDDDDLAIVDLKLQNNSILEKYRPRFT